MVRTWSTLFMKQVFPRLFSPRSPAGKPSDGTTWKPLGSVTASYTCVVRSMPVRASPSGAMPAPEAGGPRPPPHPKAPGLPPIQSPLYRSSPACMRTQCTHKCGTSIPALVWVVESACGKRGACRIRAPGAPNRENHLYPLAPRGDNPTACATSPNNWRLRHPMLCIASLTHAT